MDEMNVLQVENLCKSFGSNKVLKDISLSMKRGEVLAIIGASGGGKTTFLRCVNFLETADSGKITIGGETVFDSDSIRKRSDAELRNARLKIGLVFQQFNLFPQYTVLKNVTLAPELLKKGTKQEIHDRALEILTQIGLAEKIGFHPCKLSGGQMQRVAIARALALEPEILCFDEPTSALDPALVGEVVNVIRELKEKNTTMLIVTHDMDFAHAVADRVIFMYEGIIEEEGTTEEFFSSPKSPITRAFLNPVKKPE